MLYVVKDIGKRDLSRRRRAEFEEVCSDKALSRGGSVREARQGINNLFAYEEARMSFEKFRKYDIIAGDESNILMPIRFDAIVKDPVDNLKRIMESSQHENSILFDNDSGEDVIASSEKFANANMSLGRGGRVLQEAVDRFRALLPHATTQFLTNV